jgi:hypothetical protein
LRSHVHRARLAFDILLGLAFVLIFAFITVRMAVEREWGYAAFSAMVTCAVALVTRRRYVMLQRA